MERKIRLLIAYDGSDFCGWQKQKDHAFAPKLPSLQETLEAALSRVLNHPIEVCASGRTDAGVHALGQVAHFITHREQLPRDLCWALRAHLPPTVVVREAYWAPMEFHATLSAMGKTYRYFIWNSDRASPFWFRYSWWIRRPLDLERLQTLSQVLCGTHDFKSFQTQGTPVLHTVRTIYRIQWRRHGPQLCSVALTGDGFLKQMVRNIVGTVIDAFEDGATPQDLRAILEACDRRRAGQTAPPHGLFLQKVYYPKPLDNQCIKL
ncbi:MAG: tRNA pseudouridine(38-40) synthase TruA [Bdellovibrionaceae bacterium]|nr:tRNA pseudouridine(38-40) synthase TruA [Pseudobdellovibrionaceae bacterium]MDW8189736.1 tRNA pseudouridine(38-40) synthase TruA [Pseudobdellovibrionaceae bacterium]